jgi:hypothetical protein
MHAFIPNGVKETIRALTVEVAEEAKTRICQDSQRLFKTKKQSGSEMKSLMILPFSANFTVLPADKGSATEH